MCISDTKRHPIIQEEVMKQSKAEKKAIKKLKALENKLGVTAEEATALLKGLYP